MPASLRWAGLALLGIVIAAAVSVAASRLASQQIGLASEPISAGDALAPARREHRPAPAEGHAPNGRGSKEHGHAAHPTSPSPSPSPIQSTTPVAPAPSPPAEEVEPSHIGGDGERGGGGADD